MCGCLHLNYVCCVCCVCVLLYGFDCIHTCDCVCVLWHMCVGLGFSCTRDCMCCVHVMCYDTHVCGFAHACDFQVSDWGGALSFLTTPHISTAPAGAGGTPFLCNQLLYTLVLRSLQWQCLRKLLQRPLTIPLSSPSHQDDGCLSHLVHDPFPGPQSCLGPASSPR